MLKKLIGAIDWTPMYFRYLVAGAAGPIAAKFINQISFELAIFVVVLTFLSMIAADIFRIAFINKRLSEHAPWILYGSDKWWFIENLNNIERSACAGDEIFIITPNLDLDVTDEDIIRTVDINLGKDVCYTFLVPNYGGGRREADAGTFDMEKRIRVFATVGQRNLEKVCSRVIFYLISPNWIRLCGSDNVMIIVHKDGTRRGFLQIPDSSRRWWAEMSKEASETYLKNVNYFITKHKQIVVDLDISEVSPIIKYDWTPLLNQHKRQDREN